MNRRRPRALLPGLVIAAMLLAGCVTGSVASTPVPAMPTPLGGERPAPPGVFNVKGPVNGCDPSRASEMPTGAVVVGFGGLLGERYRERCVVVPIGTRVIFDGDFAAHPFAGGVIVDGNVYRDPSSPLPFVKAGSQAAFIPERPGVYPYFCQIHWAIGMNGAVVAR